MCAGRNEAREVLADDDGEQERVRRAVHSGEEQVATRTRERREALHEALHVRHVLHHLTGHHRVELHVRGQRGGALAGGALECAQVRLDRLAAVLDFAAVARAQHRVFGGVLARNAHRLLDDLQANYVGAYEQRISRWRVVRVRIL